MANKKKQIEQAFAVVRHHRMYSEERDFKNPYSQLSFAYNKLDKLLKNYSP